MRFGIMGIGGAGPAPPRKPRARTVLSSEGRAAIVAGIEQRHEQRRVRHEAALRAYHARSRATKLRKRKPAGADAIGNRFRRSPFHRALAHWPAGAL